MSNQLLPCPFCGHDEPTHDEGDESAWVQCTNAECGMCGPITSGSALAAAAWNRRATQPAAGETVASGVNYAEEVDLIRAVLEGYSPSIARSDALCSVKLLKSYFAAPPAAAPVAAGEPVACVDPADLDRLKSSTSVDARLYRSGSALVPLFTAPPAAAHGELPSLAGICRVADHPHGVLLILRSAPTEDDLRAIQQALRDGAAAHGELVAVVGTVPDGSGFKSLDFKVALKSLPDGTRLYAGVCGDESVREALRDAYEGGYQDGRASPNSYGSKEDRDNLVSRIMGTMRAQGDGGKDNG